MYMGNSADKWILSPTRRLGRIPLSIVEGMGRMRIFLVRALMAHNLWPFTGIGTGYFVKTVVTNVRKAAIQASHKAAPCQEWCWRRERRLQAGRAVGLVALVLMACAATPLSTSDLHPLKISMVEHKGDDYYEPNDKRILIWSQPVRLFVRIRNMSDSSVLIRVRPEMAYSIELKDDAGQTVIVKRKKVMGEQTDDDTRVDLAPGADKIIPIHINRDTWEGMPDVKRGKESKYTARIVYETAGGQIIYSEPYTLIFNIPE